MCCVARLWGLDFCTTGVSITRHLSQVPGAGVILEYECVCMCVCVCYVAQSNILKELEFGNGNNRQHLSSWHGPPT